VPNLAVDRALKLIASYGLPGAVVGELPVPLERSDWSALRGQVEFHRLAGFLTHAVENGGLSVTEDQRRDVSEMHLASCSRSLHLERRLLEMTAVLQAQNVDCLVLKGAAYAHLVYPDPAVRSFGDNDLLIPVDQFDAAIMALRDLGYELRVAPPRREFAQRFAKGVTLKAPEGIEADLHRNLVFGTFGFAIELNELFASSIEFELGGRMLKALGPETRLLHACYHAAIGDPDPRYSSVRDVAQMLTFGDQDNERVLELARRWKSPAVLARAFRLCRDYLGVAVRGPLVDALALYEPTRRERRAVASYVGENRHYAAKVAASLPYLDGVGSKLAFLRASVLPSEEFIESRGSEPRSAWIRRGLRSLLRGDLG